MNDEVNIRTRAIVPVRRKPKTVINNAPKVAKAQQRIVTHRVAQTHRLVKLSSS